VENWCKIVAASGLENNNWKYWIKWRSGCGLGNLGLSAKCDLWVTNMRWIDKDVCTDFSDSSGSVLGPVAAYCEHGNEPLGSMRGGIFLD